MKVAEPIDVEFATRPTCVVRLFPRLKTINWCRSTAFSASSRKFDGQSETEQPDHSASLGDSITSSTRIRFSVHTGLLEAGMRRRRRFLRRAWAAKIRRRVRLEKKELCVWRDLRKAHAHGLGER